MRKSAPVTAVAPPSTGDFVAQLTLAHLEFAKPSANPATLKTALNTLQAYTAPPPAPKLKKKRKKAEIPPSADTSIEQSAIMIECTTNAGTIQRVPAPVAFVPAANTSAETILTRAQGDGCKLTNLWPVILRVQRGQPMVFDPDTQVQNKVLVQQRLTHIMQSAERLVALNEADANLALIRSFIAMRQRDAAYLMVDNTKQALVKAESIDNQEPLVAERLKQLDALEAQLHRTMPFKL